MLNAIILAGSSHKGPLEITTQVSNKALIKFNNRPVVDYIIDALNNSKYVDRIVMVGPEEELSSLIRPRVEKILKPGKSIIENLEIAVQYFNSEDLILILTSDIPLINEMAIDEFIALCLEKKASLAYPIITKEEIINKYPEAQRTYVKIKDGVFCGGNIILIKPEIFFQKKEIIEQLYKNRKAAWKWAGLFGYNFILKFIFNKITIPEIEEKVSQLVGFNSVAVKISHPEMMMDLDKPSDYQVIKQYLEG